MIVAPGIKRELRWFYEARFGMFIHFGLHALLGKGEWAMYHENIPRAEYERLAEQFNPTRFDADEWVRAAEQAGAHYITVTAKHHDGFCLFDSALTSYKSTTTPFGRDLIGELIDACHRRRMRIILYYSQPDWHHPNYVHNKGAFKDLDDPPETDNPDWQKYLEYLFGQVEELCTKYGRIDGIWWDGSHKGVEEWRGKELYELVKKHHPHAVINDRARYGDFFTPERSLPEDLSNFMFEACDSVSANAWGYKKDAILKTVPYFIESIIRMARAGGNYLLNVGPAPDGSIPPEQVRIMRTIGNWLSERGVSIYNTDPAFLDLSKRVYGSTYNHTSLFIHLLTWPVTTTVRVPGVSKNVTGVKLLGCSHPLSFSQEGETVSVTDLPVIPESSLPAVIELTLEKPFSGKQPNKEAAPGGLQGSERELAGQPSVEQSSIYSLETEEKTTLSPVYALRKGYGWKGHRLTYVTTSDGMEAIGGWNAPEHRLVWQVAVQKPGLYRVSIWLGAPQGLEGAEVTIEAGNRELTVQVPATYHHEEDRRIGLITDDYVGPLEKRMAGTVELTSGHTTIVVTPLQLLWGYILGFVGPVELETVAPESGDPESV